MNKRHVHLHVISSDLIASALKTKRHYNSFSPRVGFFIPLSKVRSWFDEDATNEKDNNIDGSDGDDDDGDRQQQLLERVRFISIILNRLLRFWFQSFFFFVPG